MAGHMTSISRPGRSDADPELKSVLDTLEHLTGRLRMTARLVALFTLGSFFGALAIGFFQRTSYFVHVYVVGFGLCFPLVSIFLVLQFDLLKRKGDIVFKELSDELQWYVRYGPEEQIAGGEPTAETRPELLTRIVLREYAYSTALPLVSSSANGPALYAIVNGGLALASVFLSSFFRAVY